MVEESEKIEQDYDEDLEFESDLDDSEEIE